MERPARLESDPTRRRPRFRMVIPAYPAFNIYSRIAQGMTALGPVSVATAAHELAGWDVEIVDENNYRRSGPRDKEGLPDHETLQRLRPADVVGLYGGLTSTIPRLYRIARFYQGLGVLTIAGGQHFIEENIPEALRSGVDVVAIGEGEETIKELLEAWEKERPFREIRGIAFLENNRMVLTAARDPITDFDRLPLPDFSLVRYSKIRIYPIGRVRGCGMDCEFCTVKGKARFARPERLVEHIATLYETYGAKQFFIVDDLFGQDRKETLRLCRLLKEYRERVRARIRLAVQIRLDKAKDPELLQAMGEAGIFAVAIGFESPIPEELKAMNKRLKPEEMIELSRRFFEAGFLVHGMFIFGYPMAEGIDFRMSAKERVGHFQKFIRQARLDTVQVMLPIPLPGTAFTKRLQAQNRVFPRELIGWEYYDGNFPLIIPDPPLTPEDLHASVKQLMGSFYGFRNMFRIGLNILSFPMLLFYLHNLRRGWKRWYRIWTDDLTRFGGWIIMQRWLAAFRKSPFPQKMAHAKELLSRSWNESPQRQPGV
jgi:radical SAM superfamily enzyme YgiQ (UPF0313 family)